LIIAALATVASVGPGLLLGLSAAVSGKWGNRIMQVVIDGLLAVPTLMIALILLTLLGRGLAALVLATGASYVALFAQVTRDAALVAQSRPYIEGAHAVGASPVRIVLRHLLPNMLPTVVAFGSVIFSYSILTSAALSFLGLGGDPGQPDWGQVLADGRASLRVAPWVGIVPGALMTLTVMAVNDLADRLALAK
jgi:ABC-type dipeptide/oligopeptide/nickel transport system permease subunit